MKLGALSRPVWATLCIALLCIAYNLWLVVGGAAKLDERDRPAAGRRADFEVVLKFPPESFHQTRMQAIGRLVKVEGNTVFLKDVKRDDAIALSRNYWVSGMRRWSGS
jgi:hypothetical protein